VAIHLPFGHLEPVDLTFGFPFDQGPVMAARIAATSLAEEDAVLVIDETGFLKQGQSSCGVGRQDTGSAGKITNCQIGVFATYVSRHCHAFIDCALYLPRRWTDDPARMAAAHVPLEIGFATRPALALQMIQHAIAADVPFDWVAADSVYGAGDIEMAPRRAGKGYVLGVNATASFNSWIGKAPVTGTAENIARSSMPGSGSACPPPAARRASGCTTGPILNSPIWRRMNTAHRPMGFGHTVC
jgi:SRSO17 transposase